MVHVNLGVKGMTCASCAQTIEKTLKKLPGVSSASVNLVSNSASIDYDPKDIGIGGLKMAVKKTGYELV